MSEDWINITSIGDPYEVETCITGPHHMIGKRRHRPLSRNGEEHEWREGPPPSHRTEPVREEEWLPPGMQLTPREIPDTGLVCTTCRWRAGHSPDCPHKDEPWPTIVVEPAVPAACGADFEAPYTNWRGETRVRKLRPLSVRWGTTQWHPEPGVLICCLDLEKGEVREFSAEGFSAAAALRPALKECRDCLQDVAGGKGGWAWEEVVQSASAALGEADDR